MILKNSIIVAFLRFRSCLFNLMLLKIKLAESVIVVLMMECIRLRPWLAIIISSRLELLILMLLLWFLWPVVAVVV